MSLLVGVLGAIVAILAAWVIAARRAARRLRIAPAPAALVPLPSPGHHVALVRHPPSAPARPAPPVLLCHGLGVNHLCMDLSDDGRGSPRLSMARALSAAGFDVWVVELRGRGSARLPRGARFTVDDEVNEDVPAAIEHVLSATGAGEVWWVGHSKGAMVQLLFQASGHALAAKVSAVVAIGTPGTLAFQRRLLAPVRPLARLVLATLGDVPLSRLMPMLAPIAGIVRWVGRPFDTILAENDGPALARMFASIFADINRGVLDQTLRWVARADGAIVTMKGEKYEDGYARITLPMLLLAGAADRLAPPEAVAFVRDRVRSREVEMQVLGRAEGASHDYGHGDLVMGARAPEEVFPRVIAWLSALRRSAT